MKCINCGVEFVIKMAKQVFCSTKCKKSYYSKNIAVRDEYKCKCCGKEFSPKAKGRITYCSRECSFEDKRAKPKEKPKQVCVMCGSEFEGRKDRKYCSDDCRKNKDSIRHYDRSKQLYSKTIKPRKCKECRKEFAPEYGSKKRVFCSDKCNIRYYKKTESAKKQKKKDNQIRRARLKRVRVEPFHDNEIFERDNWVCQICGKKVNKRLKYPSQMSATLDHIIPLADGGAHERKNVQLTHFICNSKKSDKGKDQLRLFG